MSVKVLWDWGPEGIHMEGLIFLVPLMGLRCLLLLHTLWVFRNFQASPYNHSYFFSSRVPCPNLFFLYLP